MRAKPAERVLRIGIIQGGKVVEERLFRKRQRISIGLAPRNTFVLPVGGLKSHTLFDVQGAAFELVLGEGMDGRVDLDGKAAPLDFEELRKRGVARRRGNEWRVPLGDHARGKVVLPDVTVLFQFVAPPPVPAAPKLPAVARGGWIKSVDWVFTSIVIAIGIVEIGLLGYMRTLERTKKGPPRLEDLDARFAKLLAPELKKPEQPKEAAKTAKKADEGDKKGEDEAKKKASRKKVAKAEDSDSVEKAKDEARDRAAVVEKVRGTGLLKVLGAQGPGSVASKEIADVFAEGGHDRDLDQTFKRAGEIREATAGLERTRAPKGGGAEGVGTTETIDEGKVGGVARGKVKKVKVEREETRTTPKASISTGAADVEGGTLDPNAISSVVRRRLAAVKQCYERQLNRNPDLRGKITVRFTIGATGAVVDISVEANTMGDDEVAQCIVGRMRGWRFPKPEGGSVTVSYPFIFTAKQT